MNVFIEGLQGMGKSTLLQKLSQKYPAYHVYREGDYCPVELAWCSYLSEEEYGNVLDKFPSLNEDIRKWTVKEENRYIVMYTRILTDEPGFHKYMEQFEIYNGRRTPAEFEEIIFRRYQNLPMTNEGCLYECAFFQNIIEELILFQKLTDDQISQFYRKLFSQIPKENFRLFYLYDEKVEEALEQICKERCDEQGNQLWYLLMLKYLEESPYGKVHNLHGFDDLLSHLVHRQKLELRIIREILGKHAVVLPAKKYEQEQLIIR